MDKFVTFSGKIDLLVNKDALLGLGPLDKENRSFELYYQGGDLLVELDTEQEAEDAWLTFFGILNENFKKEVVDNDLTMNVALCADAINKKYAFPTDGMDVVVKDLENLTISFSNSLGVESIIFFDSSEDLDNAYNMWMYNISHFYMILSRKP